MSIVSLEFDNKLEKSKIIVPLLSSSVKEYGESTAAQSLTDKAQTSVMGIQTPLIMINNTIIDFDAVKHFSLKSTGKLPELTMIVEDRYELINNIDKPGNDNEVRVQILPKFDNAYKKIDLTFFISNIQVNGKLIRVICSYKLSSLLSSQYKTYGELDTYSLFKQVATETDLGFATNLSTLSDNRFIYCDNKSLLELMDNEIQFSNATEYIIDWWVDLWDNINLVDIKERYESIDSDEDMMIWVAGQVNETTVDNEIKPLQVVATVKDLPMYENSELYVSNYMINNSPGMGISSGTDKVYGVYIDSNKEYDDFLIQDGDIKQDIFTKYVYKGECYGDYNYLLAKELRNSYLQKINTESINITLKSPLIALMRGHKVNYIRYVNNDIVENKLSKLEEAGIINRQVESNIPLDKYETDEKSGNGSFKVDRTVSGQYLILGTEINFSNNKWEYILKLFRPAASNVTILNKQNHG